jgi:hypothetical protein
VPLVETLNLDDFDNTDQLFEATRKIVEDKLALIRTLCVLDEDWEVVVPELEALLVSLDRHKSSLVALHNFARQANVPQAQYVGAAHELLKPALIILKGHNDRKRRSAGKTDS